MSSKEKINKNTIPEGFTVGMATVDMLPVIFFGLTAIMYGLIMNQWLITAGAVVCFVSGLLKVLWKYIVALKKKNIWWMFLQMRICMLPGFLLMLLSVFLRRDTVSLSGIWAAVTAAPQCFFFGAGAAGMALMLVFGFTLDSGSVKANWIEQLTNGLAQLCIFAGLLIQVL